MGLHVCHQCDFAAFHSAKKLEAHWRKQHFDTRVDGNLTIIYKFLLDPTEQIDQHHMWSTALHFIRNKIAPDPADFRSGIQEKLPASFQHKIDDIFASLVHAYAEASKARVGGTNPPWNCGSHVSCVFLWLLSMWKCSSWDHSATKNEMIPVCVCRRAELFRGRHIAQLWAESRQARSQPPGASTLPRPEQANRSVQDATNKDTSQKVAVINADNCNYIINKYPPRNNCGYARAADFIATSHPNPSFRRQLELKVNIITSIRKKNKGRVNALFMDLFDISVRLLNRNGSKRNQAIRGG